MFQFAKSHAWSAQPRDRFAGDQQPSDVAPRSASASSPPSIVRLPPTVGKRSPPISRPLHRRQLARLAYDAAVMQGMPTGWTTSASI